jgi:hypothetical protein
MERIFEVTPGHGGREGQVQAQRSGASDHETTGDWYAGLLKKPSNSFRPPHSGFGQDSR